MQEARTVPVPLDAAFALPPDAAARAAAGGARLFFVARPNAPSGNAFGLDDIRRVCAEFPGMVWIDEAYADFAPDNCLALVHEYANVIVSRTLSKSYALAGLRLGMALARPTMIRELGKLKDSYNVDMLTQAIAVAALQDQAYLRATVARIVATRTRVAAELAAQGVKVLPSVANFLLVRPPGGGAAYAAGLRAEGFLVRHFPGARTGEFVRVTVGTDAEMEAFLTASATVLRAG
jgi:histidinol-phosphate aminotransferase